jgi:hypothetical protein
MESNRSSYRVSSGPSRPDVAQLKENRIGPVLPLLHNVEAEPQGAEFRVQGQSTPDLGKPLLDEALPVFGGSAGDISKERRPW